jgi:hypothetical protein
MDIDWNRLLVDQLDWHWHAQLRPRLDGLDDEEYFWEPVADCWSIRRRGQSRGVSTFGAGEFVIEREWPDPTPTPVTTIAWRLAHIIVGCFAARTAAHLGGPPVDPTTFEYAGTAREALSQLDDAYARWIDGVRGLGSDGLARPCGPAAGPFADEPLAAMVQHIHREVLHHGAEIALLRDLYLRLGKD